MRLVDGNGIGRQGQRGVKKTKAEKSNPFKLSWELRAEQSGRLLLRASPRGAGLSVETYWIGRCVHAPMPAILMCLK